MNLRYFSTSCYNCRFFRFPHMLKFLLQILCVYCSFSLGLLTITDTRLATVVEHTLFISVLGCPEMQSILFKTQPLITYNGIKLNQKQTYSSVVDPTKLPCDTRIKVSLVPRQLATSLQTLSLCENGALTSRKCPYFRTLLCIEIVLCCS
jgi:hypothetical protein